ncbi:MAG: hypothetical protein NTV51_12485 [Verrucomicrobia bacterium]|nr:hypothetical protein [Verrucomicrobiota bacterium]
MNRYFFRFGYCTPAQAKGNLAHGWDDECSAGVYIRADTPEEALAWGCEIADRLVQHLFEQAGETDFLSWTESQFARWIDPDPALQDLPNIPEVALRELPDLEKL